METQETNHHIISDAAAETDPNPDNHLNGDGGDADVAHDDDTVVKAAPLSRNEILKALEAVERDSAAIADSFASLFASLRLSLSQATSSTMDHMNCFSDAAGRLQECVLDASTKGNRYINSCLRLNEEMKGMDTLSTQLKLLRRHVDALDSAVDRLVRFP